MLELLVKLRQGTGRKNKEIREQGFIPAILYGQKVKNLLLMVKAKDFEKIFKEAGESTLVKLKIKGDEEKNKKDGQEKTNLAKKERVVLIYDIARDPVSDQIIHIDFNQVKLDEKIKTEIPLAFVGQSAAVERDKGVLVKNIQRIEIEAFPQDLPHQIEVDISSLETFDDNIYIKDLKVPEKVKIIAETEEVVASVIPPRTKEELEELTEAPEEKVDEVEVEAKGKEEKEPADQMPSPQKEGPKE